MHPDVYLFFDRRPELIPLYGFFEETLLSRFPDATLRVQKTQITFDAPGVFACVSLPQRKADNGLIITFGLAYRLDSPRILQASQPYPGRWTHRVLITSTEDIDDELTAWLHESRAFALIRKR